jgi:hypothetical protein
MMESRAFSLSVACANERIEVAGKTPFTIRRSVEMDLVLPFAFLSPRQAEIQSDAAGQG